jgi:hypothetical protein
MEIRDARVDPTFVGTAAAINASVHDQPEVESDAALRDRRATLEAEIAEIDEQLGDEDDEE